MFYGGKNWKITKNDEHLLDTFQTKLRIRWQQKVPVKKIGHILRKEVTNNCKAARGENGKYLDPHGEEQ